MKDLGVFRLIVFFTLFLASIASANAESQQMKKFSATINDNGVQKVDVIGGGYFYDPNYIIVKVNVPVELVVTKESGLIPHDIAMHSSETGIDFREDLSTKPKTITFTPTKVGKYPFYCTKKLLFFESHKDKGMKGILEVRAD